MGGSANLSNQSTEKAMRVLEFLANQTSAVRLSEIAGALKINESTVSRFLAALQRCGYVTQDEGTQWYRLTYKICRVANRFVENSEHRDIIHPYLGQVTERFRESCCVSAENNLRMVYTDVVAGPDRSLMSLQSVGNTAPMHCTGNGKLILSTYTEEKLDLYIKEKGLKQYTANTITTKKALLKELAQIRRCGHAYDNEECEIGVRCVACPIRDYTGNIVAGISVTGPTSRFSKESIEDNLPFLKEVAGQISTRLGYADNS